MIVEGLTRDILDSAVNLKLDDTDVIRMEVNRALDFYVLGTLD